MKNKIILIILLFVFVKVNAQIGPVIYSDTNYFESPNIHLEIDTTQIGNLWQIGTPMKPIFNAAYSPTHAIITDTLNNTPQNNLSSFTLKFLPDFWGSGKLTFRHQYDMDSLHAGGYIDISYNGGTDWVNIVNDTMSPDGFYNWMFTNSNNFYSRQDTIYGNIPAFTGSSNGWQLSEYVWVYMMMVKWNIPSDSILIRFNFISDATAINKEGWMIDDITFNGYQIMGGIETYQNDNSLIRIFPNPANEYINIESKTDLKSIKMYSVDGKLVYDSEINKKHSTKISMNAFKQGVYFIKTVDINENTSFNKIIKTQ